MIARIRVRFVAVQDITLKNGIHISTLGTWWEDGDILDVQVAKMSLRAYEYAVLFHELIEYAWCHVHGVGTEECDKFDEWFEEQYRNGTIPKTEEAGYDKRCPYHRGHVWGGRFERAVIFILGASWKSYVAEANRLMGL